MRESSLSRESRESFSSDESTSESSSSEESTSTVVNGSRESFSLVSKNSSTRESVSVIGRDRNNFLDLTSIKNAINNSQNGDSDILGVLVNALEVDDIETNEGFSFETFVCTVVHANLRC